jgi:pantetheine-phosphate adenylyltransferase
VLVAVNSGKQPSGTPSDRAIQLRRELPADWDNVSVAAWAGLTVAFCRQHGASVIIRGVRNGSDLLHEYQLAAMNEALGITTLLLPAQPGLTGVSTRSTRASLPSVWRQGDSPSSLGSTASGWPVPKEMTGHPQFADHQPSVAHGRPFWEPRLLASILDAARARAS